MRFFEVIGSAARFLWNEVLDLLALIWISIMSSRSIFRRSRRRIFFQLVNRQLYQAGYQALPVIAAIAALTGALLVVMLHSLAQGQSFTDLYARFYIVVIFRELSPLICGVVLIARSASAMTAEISYLKISREFDVLRSMGVNPVSVFLLPVFIAFPLVLLVNMVVFDFVSVFAGYATILLFEPGRGMYEFLVGISSRMDGARGVLVMAKGLLGGIFIGVVSIYFGSSVGTRFTEMTDAIARATSTQLMLFFLISVSLSITIYLT